MTPQPPAPHLASHYSQIRTLLSKAGYGPLAISRMLGHPSQPLPQFVKLARLATRNPHGRAAKLLVQHQPRVLRELADQPPANLVGTWTESTLASAIAGIAVHDLHPGSESIAQFV